MADQLLMRTERAILDPEIAVVATWSVIHHLRGANDINIRLGRCGAPEFAL
jgi:hypothetical protein